MIFDNLDRPAWMTARLKCIVGQFSAWPVSLNNENPQITGSDGTLCADSHTCYHSELQLSNAPSHSCCLRSPLPCRISRLKHVGARDHTQSSDFQLGSTRHRTQRAAGNSFLSQHFDGWKIKTATLQHCFPGNPFTHFYLISLLFVDVM